MATTSTSTNSRPTTKRKKISIHSLWLLVALVWTIVSNLKFATKITTQTEMQAQAPRNPKINDDDNDTDDDDTPLSSREVPNPTIIDNKEVEIDARTKPTTTTTNKNILETTTTDTSIRKWGCDLPETPLIFVHNGKSGGGNIRARLAASALNYERQNEWHISENDEHYYPVPNNVNVNGSNDNSTIRHGKFCNSKIPHYITMPHIATPLTTTNYEGNQKCNATTPLGIAVACPHPYIKGAKSGHCQMCDDEYYLQANYYNAGTTLFDEDNNTNTTDQHHRRLERKRQKKEKPQKKGKRQRKEKRQKKGRKKPVPQPFSETVLDPKNDPPPGSTCDVVFTAHNNIGSELNWLPPRYLKEHWWDQSEYKSRDELEKYWEVLLDDRHRRRKKLGDWAEANRNGTANTKANPEIEKETDDSDTNHRWCPEGYMSSDGTTEYDRPSTGGEYELAYQNCSLPLAERADRAFLESFSPSGTTTTTATLKNFSPFYASMPLHRVTMMRDPWSWIISKFFWHDLPEQNLTCYDVHGVMRDDGFGFAPLDQITGRELSWMEQYSFLFLIRLCGNDCRIRYENGIMALDEIEAQVASNLRNAFSVVGILHETESFYDMITDRISYVDMALNLNVKGRNHATQKTDENIACKKLFGTDEIFRELVRKTVPVFAALERTYHLGIEVNAFQKEELRQCKEAKGEQPTRGTYE